MNPNKFKVKSINLGDNNIIKNSVTLNEILHHS
jgi:hypothetical protein